MGVIQLLLALLMVVTVADRFPVLRIQPSVALDLTALTATSTNATNQAVQHNSQEVVQMGATQLLLAPQITVTPIPLPLPPLLYPSGVKSDLTSMEVMLVVTSVLTKAKTSPGKHAKTEHKLV